MISPNSSPDDIDGVLVVLAADFADCARMGGAIAQASAALRSKYLDAVLFTYPPKNDREARTWCAIRRDVLELLHCK